MKKRLQIILNDAAWAAVESLSNEANSDFDGGHINYSALINEMILSSKVDIKTLQLKHTDLRKSLRALASKGDIDLDTVLKTLSELKSTTKKKVKLATTEVAPA